MGKYAVELSKAQLFELIDAAPDATVIVAESGAIVFANSRMKEVFGYDPAELLHQSIEVLLPVRFRKIHPGHRAKFVTESKARPMGADLELFGQRKNGTEFPVEISLSAINTPDGKLVSSAIRDITARKQLENSLAGILESSLNEVYIFEASSLKFIQVNEGARNNLGYTMEELRSMTPVDIKPDFDGQGFATQIEPLRNGSREIIVFQSRHRRKDGSTYPVEAHLQHMLFDTRPVFVALILDITERKEFEAELAGQNVLLEKRVVQRTEDLHKASQVAENATATKSRFLAAASHDLRQPLQAISLYLSVLKRQLNDPELGSIVNKIDSSVEVMGELLEALLDISKLESGSIAINLMDVNIQDLVAKLISENEMSAQRKGLELRCTGDKCVVHTDPVLLHRVLANFVSNAIRYTEKGHISINCIKRNGFAHLEVSDTGPGIPADALNTIFEEYYQLGNNVRDRRKGLGLGLSIVKHVARLLDHKIGVTSEANRGSTFSIDVPFGHGTEISEKNGIARSSSVVASKPVVLFIDDDEAIVDATTMLLHSAHVETHSALNGDEAMALIDQGLRPDVLISDYRLPGRSGVEIIRLIRTATQSTVPTIIMTGDTSTKDIKQAQLPNCTIMHKPVDSQALLDFIKKCT